MQQQKEHELTNLNRKLFIIIQKKKTCNSLINITNIAIIIAFLLLLFEQI